MDPGATIGVLVMLMAITIAFTVARFVFQRHKEKSASSRWTAFFLVMSTIQEVVMVSLNVYRLHSHLSMKKGGSSEQDVAVELRTPHFLKLSFVGEVLYLTSLWSIKAAFLLMYRGFFRRVQGALIWTLHVAVVVTVASFLVVEISLFTWCRPLSDNWAVDAKSSQVCDVQSSDKWNLMVAAVNVFNNTIILVVPMAILKVASFGRKETIALAIVFGVGAISIIASLIRIAILHTAFIHATLNNLSTQHRLLIISNWETSLAIIAFCLPAFRVFIITRRRATKLNQQLPPQGLSTRTWAPTTTAKRPIDDYELEDNDSQEHLQAFETPVQFEPGAIHISHTVDIKVEVCHATTKSTGSASGAPVDGLDFGGPNPRLNE